ncbi:HAD domain-containing protein [Azohydromonas aeria]|uniref:HAD domain-containing protein n=1 Tax=Azohydromonas aeria TaxID=2590212 RepID=UPI0012FA2569|nr:HAD domain-containing protein [Azohydromonas aeria]
MTRLVFLDLDGVVNSTRTQVAFGGYPQELHHPQWDEVSLALLRRLSHSAGIQFVLSSAWRNFCDFKDAAKALDLPIIDRTPSLCGCRGDEIAHWLAEHPEVEAWAILDDTPDMLEEQQSRFVQTNPEEGLSWANFVRLCDLFGESPFAGEARRREWRTEKLAWER